MGKILKNIESIVLISPVEGASCKFKGPCTECMNFTNSIKKIGCPEAIDPTRAQALT